MTLRLRWPFHRDATAPPPKRAVNLDRSSKDLDLRVTSFSSFIDRSYALTATAVDRYRTSAQTVQTAAAALGVLYTGALALVFGEDGGLPARGLLSPAFLALAMVSAMAYLAYQSPQWRIPRKPPLWGRAAQANAYEQLGTYRIDVTELVTRNLGALHASVLALGLAILFAPAPFVGGDAPSNPALTPWPSPPGTGDAALALYGAELEEVAAIRIAERTAPGDFFTPDSDGPWLIAGAAALALVLLIAVRTTTNVRRDLTPGRDAVTG